MLKPFRCGLLSLLLLPLLPLGLFAQANPPAQASPPTVAPVAPAPPAVPAGIVVLHDVVFGKGGTRELHAEVAYPKDATGPLPGVIYIHGGGWIKGSQKEQLQWNIIPLAQKGYVAASIEYRLDDVAKWPAQIQDCKLAVRWLRANAAQYRVNPGRIGVWGGSAGGHLAACVGTMAGVQAYEGDGGYPGVSSAVQAVVDYFGPVDFTRPEIYTPGAIKLTEGLMGLPYAQNPALWKSASPLYSVKAGDPPVLMVHGDADPLVPLAQSTAFDEALGKAGVPHQLLVVRNAVHSLNPVPGKKIDPPWGVINQTVQAFLDKYLKAAP